MQKQVKLDELAYRGLIRYLQNNHIGYFVAFDDKHDSRHRPETLLKDYDNKGYLTYDFIDNSLVRFLNENAFNNCAVRILLQHHGQLAYPSTTFPIPWRGDSSSPEKEVVEEPTDQSKISIAYLQSLA